MSFPNYFAFHLTEPPSTPGKPEATDWGSDFIELSWTPPKEDGGSPVTGYIIQKKVKGSNLWEKGTEVVGTETKGKVPFLVEGQDYEFRVIALNQGGESKPSEPSELITARPRFCKFFLLDFTDFVFSDFIDLESFPIYSS